MASGEGEQALKRDVGWYGSFSMGYADVGADIYVALGLVAFYAAGASPLAFAIASITYICTGFAYGELATAYPYAGGAQVYTMKAMNDLMGFIAGWAVMLDYTVDISLFSLATAGYLSFFIPWIKSAAFTVNLTGLNLRITALGLTSLLLVAALIGINLLGIRKASILNELLVSLDLAVESLILVLGVLLAFNLGLFTSQIGVMGADKVFQNITYAFQGLDYRRQNFIYGVTLAMCSFIGIESISQAAEETRKPHKWIPRATKLSILAVLIFAVTLSSVAMGMVPWTELAESQTDPMAVLARSIPIVGGYIAPIVAFTGFAICYVSSNTGVIGVSRVVFSMGKFNLMPRWFYKVHPSYRTPYRTILIFGSIGAVLSLLGELHFVADLYNFGALLSYILVNLSLIILRNTDVDAYRAWRAPGNLGFKVKGRRLSIPVTGLIGLISCTVIWLLVISYHPVGRILGTAWIAAGLIVYAVYRWRSGLGLTGKLGGAQVKPSAYVFNALILVRIPENHEKVAEAIRASLDKRFKLTLFTVIDPEEHGFSMEDVRQYQYIKEAEEEAYLELETLARRLRDLGYECSVKVEVGPQLKIIELEASSDANDLIVLIRRRTLKGHLVKIREKSIQSLISRYPGKLMVVRRG
ncbi:MAG: amino acid permease [Candidatus Bathyarchaeia archaeon]|nr:amino acid permease [Candidatus Bathyarchaeota archaeon]